MLCLALAPGGNMYVSFKYGETDRLKDGRKFTDLTEQGLERILATIAECELNDWWVTTISGQAVLTDGLTPSSELSREQREAAIHDRS